MNIPCLGPLYADKHIPEWLISTAIPIPYFDGLQLSFTLDGLREEDDQHIDEAIRSFLRLTSENRLSASTHIFQNYREMVNAVGEDKLAVHIASVNDVWAHVQPSEIFVSKRGRRDNLIYIQIGAECDWEIEHGLQIVYRSGCILSRVSAQDGHLTYTDAYDVPEDQDRIDG